MHETIMGEPDAKRMGRLPHGAGAVSGEAVQAEIDFVSSEPSEVVDRNEGLDDPAGVGESRPARAYRV